MLGNELRSSAKATQALNPWNFFPVLILVLLDTNPEVVFPYHMVILFYISWVVTALPPAMATPLHPQQNSNVSFCTVWPKLPVTCSSLQYSLQWVCNALPLSICLLRAFIQNRGWIEKTMQSVCWNLCTYIQVWQTLLKYSLSLENASTENLSINEGILASFSDSSWGTYSNKVTDPVIQEISAVKLIAVSLCVQALFFLGVLRRH